jgi:1,4-dihydroxy-2-naphthoate octaprenyltransferase
MIMGTTYVIQGSLEPEQWLASLPYGLIVASVLVGKHVDKREADLGVGVKSVPAILGQDRSLLLNKISFVSFYVLMIGLVILNVTGPWILLSLLAIGRLRTVWKVYSEPKPEKPPEEWTVWPLWYVGWAMYFNRRAGELFVLGLFLNIVIPKIAAIF